MGSGWGSHAGLCCCRGALGVRPGTPQVLAAAQGGVLWGWRAAGAGVSPKPCRGAAAPGRAAQPGGTPQLPNPPTVPFLELPLPPHSSLKWPPQRPSRPPAPSHLQPSWPPGPRCASPYLGIALSLWTHLLLLWLHNPRVVQGLLTAIPFPWGGRGPYLSERQICRFAYLSEVLLYGDHTHSPSPPQHFPLLSCLPEEAGAISRTILAIGPHMMV